MRGLVPLCAILAACGAPREALDASMQDGDSAVEIDASVSAPSGFATFSIPLPDEVRYTAGEGVVEDAVTGLTWQAEVDGVQRTWAEATAYCEALSLGERAFRLPTRIELLSIVIPGRIPAADPVFGAKAEYHWTASSPGPAGDVGYVIYFGSHELGRSLRTTRAHVRCVSGGGVEAPHVVHAELVEDHGTGLEWERAEGARGAYADAVARCEALTLDEHDDWRLPSLAELSSTVDERIGAVDATVFTVSGSLLWTQSNDESGFGNWPLDPTNGTVLPGSTTSTRASRCVRRARALP